MENYSDAEMKALQKDKAFMRIWDGGVMVGQEIDIRSMVTEENDRVVLNGRKFTRSSWDWRPPQIIRGQGRLAKEYSDPRNNHPEISIYTEGGKLLRLDACPCGGELEMDHNYNLYCLKCFRIYE
ncbi:hypothetical protein M0R72_17770 [Candidatus Pacearchaeota archaeon]|jgi:hypothetical protein|nr:hypothetical protein [Candidatus Pacearchaeota archaeon]